MKFKTKWELEKDFGYEIGSDKIRLTYLEYEKKINEFITSWLTKDGKILKTSLYIDNFDSYLQDMDVLNKDIYPLMKYLSLKSALDVSDQDIQKIQSELYKNFEGLSEKLLFIDEVWKNIGYDKLIELSKIHTNYTNYLFSVAESIKYILSDKEERVVLKISKGNDLYDEYKGSILLDYKGEKKTLVDISGDRLSLNRDDRKLAFKTLSDFYNTEYNNVIFKNIYSDVCKSNISNMELRDIKGVMTSRNISEELDSSVVDKLIDIVSSNYNLFESYLNKKKEFLKLDDFNVYDILAPFESSNSTLDFEKGCEIYLNTIRGVDESIYQHGVDMLNGKTDVYPMKGKSGGAFCSYDKYSSQYVLLNWQDKLDDLNTLAHEFGHAFHGYLSLGQPNVHYSSPLVLAETASIFNETVIFNELLNHAKDENDKKILIFNRLDDLFSTIFRQIMYISFEKRCHESWEKNIPLTSDDYNGMWLEEFKKLVGSSITWNEENENMVKWGWMSIPHIYHTPFYCYAYSFGNLLALNVYEGYDKSTDKKSYLNKYFELLKSGGSKRPKELLKNIYNYDIEDTNFYMMGINYIKDLINKI